MIIVDTFQAMDSNRIPICDYNELITAHNVNLGNSEDSDSWFDWELPDNLTVLSDTEFFDTFVE